jgi:hypothetical protein
VLPANSIIADDLKDWGKQAGWAVLWQLPESPVVPAPASISGDFQTAVTTVVKALHDQGISIRVRFYTYAGANTAVLTSDGTPDNAQVGANVDSSSNN